MEFFDDFDVFDVVDDDLLSFVFEPSEEDDSDDDESSLVEEALEFEDDDADSDLGVITFLAIGGSSRGVWPAWLCSKAPGISSSSFAGIDIREQRSSSSGAYLCGVAPGLTGTHSNGSSVGKR